MQKNSTLSNKTDFLKTTKGPDDVPEFQPQNDTLNRILQFAGMYRVEKTKDNQYVELFLN